MILNDHLNFFVSSSKFLKFTNKCEKWSFEFTSSLMFCTSIRLDSIHLPNKRIGRVEIGFMEAEIALHLTKLHRGTEVSNKHRRD